jgi:hypothetical protein
VPSRYQHRILTEAETQSLPLTARDLIWEPEL